MTRLLELIDEADIFKLFWSTNSMKSEYVRRQWEHALTLRRVVFIRPTYWEVPMPQSTNPPLPPEELARLHLHGFFEESDGDLHESWSAGRPSPSLGPKPSLPSRAAQDLENLTQYLEIRTERYHVPCTCGRMIPRPGI